MVDTFWTHPDVIQRYFLELFMNHSKLTTSTNTPTPAVFHGFLPRVSRVRVLVGALSIRRFCTQLIVNVQNTLSPSKLPVAPLGRFPVCDLSPLDSFAVTPFATAIHW